MIKHTTKTAALCLSLAALIAPLQAEEYDTQSEQVVESQVESQEEALRVYFENELCSKQTRIEDLERLVGLLEQEKTGLQNQCISRNRNVETAEQQVQTVTNEINVLKNELTETQKKSETSKKQLDQTKITLKKTERANAQLTQDVQDAQQKTDIGIPAGTIAGIVAGYFISGYFSK